MAISESETRSSIWARYTPEQKAKYNARKRREYADRGEKYQRVVALNKAWRDKNKDKVNAARRDKWRSDKEWREAQLEKRRGRDQRHTQLKTHYGITKAQYDEMLLAQGGKCAICSVDPKETLCVDHCHDSGRVRALLCRSCNTGLGCFKDDLSLFGLAIRYLEKWR